MANLKVFLILIILPILANCYGKHHPHHRHHNRHDSDKHKNTFEQQEDSKKLDNFQGLHHLDHKKKILIGVFVSLAVLVAVGVTVGICCRRRCCKKKEEEETPEAIKAKEAEAMANVACLQIPVVGDLPPSYTVVVKAGDKDLPSYEDFQKTNSSLPPVDGPQA